MSMKALNDIRDMLCEELDELARKGELGAGDLETPTFAALTVGAVLTVAATAILWDAIAGMTPVSICAASYRT